MAYVKVGSTYYPEGRVPKEVKVVKRTPSPGYGTVMVGGREYIVGLQYVPGLQHPTQDTAPVGRAAERGQVGTGMPDISRPPEPLPSVKYEPPTTPPKYLPSEQETARTEKLREAAAREAERAEVAKAYQKHLYQPVEEKLALGRPTTPWQMEAFGGTLKGVGTLLSLAFGHPEIREKEFSYAAKYPAETAWKTGVGLVSWPIISGAEIVGHVRKGEHGQAFGSLATTAAVVGVSVGVGKITYKFGTKVKGYKSTPMKGMAAKTKLKLEKKPISKAKKAKLAKGLKELYAPTEKYKPTRKAIVKAYAKPQPKIEFKYKELMKITKEKPVVGFIVKPKPKPTPKLILAPMPKQVSYYKPKAFTLIPKARKKQREAALISILPRQSQKQRQRMFQVPSLGLGLKQVSAQKRIPKQVMGMGLGLKQVSAQKSLLGEPTAFLPKTRRGTGRKRRTKKPRRFLPTPPLLPLDFGFKPRRRRAKKKRKPIFRKYRYTPSLGGVVRLVPPTFKMPKTTTGLRMRPMIKRRKKSKKRRR